jgi:hypothetical protein
MECPVSSDPCGNSPDHPVCRSSPATRHPPPAPGPRRRQEIAFLARELFQQVQGVLGAVGDLVPGELAAGAGELGGNPPLQAVAERLDDALRCFDLLQEELGLPGDCEPRYRRSLAGGP